MDSQERRAYLDFHKKFFELRARTAPFYRASDFETIKTVGAITALLNRADVLYAGCKDNIWLRHQHYTPEQLIDRATGYIEALERGEFPLKGMSCEPGCSTSDLCFIEDEHGVLHVFYNRYETGYDWGDRGCDTLGHATTTDLINWDICRPVLTIDNHSFEDCQIWSPGIIKHGDTYFMYYTGVNFSTSEAGCLATSKDLFNWEKYEGNPIVVPGEWSPWRKDQWSDCRDGMVFDGENGKYYQFYCAVEKKENGEHRSVLGVATSTDLYHWHDEGPFKLEQRPVVSESPFIQKNPVNGKFYMLCMREVYVNENNDFLHGWKYYDNNGVKISEDCPEIFQYKGKWYIAIVNYRGLSEQYLEIKELFWNEDGSITVGQFIR